MSRQRPFHEKIETEVNKYIQKFENKPFMAIHGRRLETVCETFRAYLSDEITVREAKDYCNLTPTILEKYKFERNIPSNISIHLSTDGTPEYAHVDHMLMDKYHAHRYEPSVSLSETENLMVEMGIMMKSSFFVGHTWSSMSGVIAIGREASGFPVESNILPGYSEKNENLIYLSA